MRVSSNVLFPSKLKNLNKCEDEKTASTVIDNDGNTEDVVQIILD